MSRHRRSVGAAGLLRRSAVVGECRRARRSKAESKAESKARLPETPAQFGLSREVTPSVDLASIESTIPGHFDGWYPRRRIRLANGQVWQVAEETTRLYELDNPKVTIRRGVLGAYYLDLSIDNRSIRVNRVE